MPPRLIAITGGIGAGKSVVSRVLRCMGYPVLDCDTLARELMDADAAIKARLKAEIAPDVVDDSGVIVRPRLAAIVFADAARLAALNAIVHSSVREAIARWKDDTPGPLAFVETAILFQSRLNRDVDAEWRVEAPEAIRIGRVMKRNGLSAEEVKARIDSQQYTPNENEVRPTLTVIANDGRNAILPQIIQALAENTPRD